MMPPKQAYFIFSIGNVKPILQAEYPQVIFIWPFFDFNLADFYLGWGFLFGWLFGWWDFYLADVYLAVWLYLAVLACNHRVAQRFPIHSAVLETLHHV